MKSFLLILSAFILFQELHAQQNTDTAAENRLDEVTVRAFEHNRHLKDVPAAINFINRAALERFSPASVLQAVNTTPGVRMEERSPGSYRFSVRGSSLRSPFGVRNVKVYFNDIPITDPGGQTYLNQLGYYNFNSLEIIKGPGSSLYGAGTGGVLLIESLNENEQPGAQAEYTGGSYNFHNLYASLTTGTQKLVSRVSFQHQESDGYRDHSALKKDVHSWTGLFRFSEKNFLKASFLYGDLFYETPGALTLSEYRANPRASRPAGGGFPSAAAAKAAIHQRSFLAGISYVQQLLPKWQNKSVLYGMFTGFTNPAVRNYGRNSEPHVGGRTTFRFGQPLKQGMFNLDMGGEWQEGFSSVTIFKNNAGNADSLRTYDDIHNRQSYIFSQASLDLRQWTITAGASWNWMRVKFQRFTPATTGWQRRDFNNQIAPRFSILRKLGNVDAYTSISKGFSPPGITELVPSGSAVNLGLEPEQGVNYDLGIRGNVFRRLSFDVNAFIFSMDNGIVQRRDAGGGDYYINSGKKQKGIETYASYQLFRPTDITGHFLFWASHTWHDFHYKKFKELTNDYSGNQLPGEPTHALSTGLDFLARNGISAVVSCYISGKVPQNDANMAYADSYRLLSARVGFQRLIREIFRVRFMAGADNLLNERYSLGNDINAFGGRYYNAAPGRNYYAGVLVQWKARKQML